MDNDEIPDIVTLSGVSGGPVSSEHVQTAKLCSASNPLRTLYLMIKHKVKFES